MFLGFIFNSQKSPIPLKREAGINPKYFVPVGLLLLFFLISQFLNSEKDESIIIETQNFGTLVLEDLKARDMVIIDENDSDIAFYDGEPFDLKQISEMLLKLDRLPADIREKLIATICKNHPNHFLCGEGEDVPAIWSEDDLKYVGIQELPISIRTFNILRHKGIVTIKDLFNYIEEIAKNKGSLTKAITEINSSKYGKLGKKGFTDLWNAIVESGYSKWLEDLRAKY